MIHFFLFGKFGNSASIKGIDNEFIQKQQDSKVFDPSLVFNIATSLYQIGTELDGGNLKDFDLKSFQITSKYTKDHLLVVGFNPKYKNSKKYPIFKEKISKVHEYFLQKMESGFKNVDTDLCREELRKMLDNVPQIKRSLKKMDFTLST